MLMAFEDVISEIEVGAAELTIWIEQHWVLPVEEDGNFLFDSTDVARCRLIAELRRDMGVNEEAMPVVLRLLDQVYNLRRALTDLTAAIKTLPDAARDQLEAELRKATEATGTADEED
jgi:chaperone modulatory protein CbpM